MSEGMDTRRVPGTEILGKRELLDHDYRLKLYDFRRPDKFSKEQLRSMQIINEAFARQITAELSSALRQVCEVTLTNMDQLSYTEFLAPLQAPSLFAISSFNPLRGMILMHIDKSCTDAIIERLFGARSNSSVEIPVSAELTHLEFGAIEPLICSSLSALGYAWSSIEEIKPALAQFETNAMFCEILPPLEMIALASFSLRTGDSVGTMNIVYPYLMLEPILRRLTSLYWRSENTQAPKSGAQVRLAWRTPLPSQILSSAGSFSVAELGKLKKGSVIFLPEPDSGWLRCGAVNVAELSGLTRDIGNVSANVDTPEDSRDDALLEERTGHDADPMRSLTAEVREGMAALKAGMANALAEMKSEQENLKDTLVFGQSGEAVEGQRIASLDTRPFASLAGTSPETLSLSLNGERQQLLALVLSNLEDSLASRLFTLLPETIQPEVAQRIATMDWVSPTTVKCLEKIILRDLSTAVREGVESGGIAKAAGILNLVSRETEKKVFDSLDANSPRLSSQIKKNMFVFDDLSMLDSKVIADILAAVDERDMLMAMKPVSELVRGRLFARFPEGERERLKAAYAELGRIRLPESEAAGLRIVAAVLSMEEEGRIEIDRDGLAQ